MFDIKEKLNEIERKENIRILLAVESGSRAWGFASPDSDYDVRFIHVRTEEDYLRLEGIRDVLEYPIDDDLDINGWDLQKALKLLYRSNPTLFEWLSSPIVYRETESAEMIRKIMMKYFSSKKGLYHYLSMAEGNYREYLKGETVRAKKYFYVLRPVLACLWILDHGTNPPMLFEELMEAEMEPSVAPSVKELLRLKMNEPEKKLIRRVDAINGYLDRTILELWGKLSRLSEEEQRGWEELNDIFLRELRLARR